MIYIKTDDAYNDLITDDANEFIKNFLHMDCPNYADEMEIAINDWEGRMVLIKGNDFDNLKFGCMIRYIFQKTLDGYDMEIEEITLAEDMDDFLDLYNEIPILNSNFAENSMQ